MSNIRSIRARTLRAWFRANLADSARDIARRGAAGGFYGITYHADTEKLFRRFDVEIFAMLADAADDQGCDVPTLLSHFGCAGTMSDAAGFYDGCVWFACETLAREMSDARGE